MSEAPLPRALIQFQLAVLDAYERLLGSCAWDEAKLNDALKSAMTSLLPLLRAQRALGAELFDANKELVRHYRQALEAALRQDADKPAPSDTEPP